MKPKPKCHSVFHVIDQDGRSLFKTPRARAAKMLRTGSAIELPGTNCIRLTGGYTQRWSGCTRVARKGVLAAIGRSQCYTYAQTSSVGTPMYAFKDLHPADRPLFQAAALGIDP
jgi:hypothetical protein